MRYSLGLIKHNLTIIIFAISLILLVDYVLLLEEGRLHDADTVGTYAGILLVIGCLTHLFMSLLRARKKTVEHRVILKIPVFKSGKLCVYLLLLSSIILSFISFFFLNDFEETVFFLNATCLFILIMIILHLLMPVVPSPRPKLIIRIPMHVLREYFTRERIRTYIVENPGAPFILSFQLLLIVYLILLIKGAEAMVNNLVVYAYYVLTIGILLQIFSYIRGKRRRA